LTESGVSCKEEVICSWFKLVLICVFSEL